MATYQSVNSRWPEGTNDGRDLKPTPQEAMSAARRLYRFAMKRPFKGKMRVTSGNRYTWIRSGVFYVNPDYRGGGWHELVHLISHQMAHRLYPGAKSHGGRHAFVEREMVEHVVSSGWLDGKLKSKATGPKTPDPIAAIDAKVKRWETKRRRAETALRKLKRQRAYYERKAA